MTSELKKALSPYSFILHKTHTKKIRVPFLLTHRWLKNILFNFPGVSALMLRKTFKSLQSSCEIHVTGSKFVPLSHHKSK